MKDHDETSYNGNSYGEDAYDTDSYEEGVYEDDSYDEASYDGNTYEEDAYHGNTDDEDTELNDTAPDGLRSGEPVAEKISMKRKLLIVLPLLIVIMILALILFFTREKKEEKQVLLEKGGYTVTTQGEKDGKLRLLLDGSPSKDSSWILEAEETIFLEIQQDGKEKNGKAEYLLTPKEAGEVKLSFVRKAEVQGISYELVRVSLPVLVTDDNGPSLLFEDGSDIVLGSIAGGLTTDMPYLIRNSGDGTAVVTLPDKSSDWYFTDPDGIVDISVMNDEEGRRCYRFKSRTSATEADPGEGDTESSSEFEVSSETAAELLPFLGVSLPEDAVEVTEEQVANPYASIVEKYRGYSSDAEDGSKKALILAINLSKNTTEFLDASVSSDGSVSLAPGQEPKEK